MPVMRKSRPPLPSSRRLPHSGQRQRGDLAGFSIQMSELIMLTAYVFVSKAVNI